eukprot:scaffold62237_cov28-Tisochrysis_lutea.AAC.3
MPPIDPPAACGLHPNTVWCEELVQSRDCHRPTSHHPSPLTAREVCIVVAATQRPTLPPSLALVKGRSRRVDAELQCSRQWQERLPTSRKYCRRCPHCCRHRLAGGAAKLHAPPAQAAATTPTSLFRAPTPARSRREAIQLFDRAARGGHRPVRASSLLGLSQQHQQQPPPLRQLQRFSRYRPG